MTDEREPTIQARLTRTMARRVQQEVLKQFGLTDVHTLGIAVEGFTMDLNPGGGLVTIPLQFKASAEQINAIRQAAFLDDVERRLS